jgi:hypothetical protein
MAIDDDKRQEEFERGQEYETHIQPFNHPVKGIFESDEDFGERDAAFESGRKSIQNDPNQ